MQKETSEDSPEDNVPESGEVIGRKLDSLMREKKIFLEKGNFKKFTGMTPAEWKNKNKI